MNNTCFHCGAPATKLCDFHIGQVIGEYVRDGSIDVNRWRAVTTMKCLENGEAFYTCDRPLCDACTTNRGRIFICGEEPTTDTYDHCKDHAKSKTQSRDAPMLLPAEAAKIRRELHLRLTPPRGKPEMVKA